MPKLTVIDFFCGAGGFSEGFRQQGFDIIMGVDNWLPAIETFNHNFGLNCKPMDMLAFQDSVDEIETLPDTDVIIGSPPCTSFSSSNISGKANKDSGITLTKAFLRIVAVKKFKKKSRLRAWYMENVCNSVKYLQSHYTFRDLDLKEWAQKKGLDPDKRAVSLEDNQLVVNAKNYGVAQNRKRVISGEVICKGKLTVPPATCEVPITLREIKSRLPKPSLKDIGEKDVSDPMYPTIRIKMKDLSDHFYDTSILALYWKQSKFLKTNHPFMGKMSFPENENNPSRTITATKTGSSRESIIYPSEYRRKGDGEYRTPTVREAASIMGFPITYQFKSNSEGIKWKLVGNAVCPPVSSAFAKQLRNNLKMVKIKRLLTQENVDLSGVQNLNFRKRKQLSSKERGRLRIANSRFRRQPFKDGNMTVTLSNYDIAEKGKFDGKWMASVQYGTGENFLSHSVPERKFATIERMIKKVDKGNQFIEQVGNGFSDKIGTAHELQLMYERGCSYNEELLEPTELVEEIERMLEVLGVCGDYKQNRYRIFEHKEIIPNRQLCALYAIIKICSVANGGRYE